MNTVYNFRCITSNTDIKNIGDDTSSPIGRLHLPGVTVGLAFVLDHFVHPHPGDGVLNLALGEAGRELVLDFAEQLSDSHGSLGRQGFHDNIMGFSVQVTVRLSLGFILGKLGIDFRNNLRKGIHRGQIVTDGDHGVLLHSDKFLSGFLGFSFP